MEKTIELYLSTEEATKLLGQKLALIAQTGDVFALFGTLGMGKSVLARAFVQELCGPGEVPSPTFTLLQTYEAPNFDIYHFDLYRLKSAEDIFEIGMEEAIYGGVSLIEWPEKMGGYLPRDIFRIEISSYKNGRKVFIKTTSEDKFLRLSGLKEALGG